MYVCVCVCVCVVGVKCARPIHRHDQSFSSRRSFFMDGECIRVGEEAARKWCEQEGQIPVMQVSMVAWITVLRVDTKKREKTWERVTGCLDVGQQWKGSFWFEPSNWWDDTFLRRSREQEAGRRIEDVRKLWTIYIWDIRENEFWIWKGGSQRS